MNNIVLCVNWYLLSNIASGVTLFMFVAYIVGRIIVILSEIKYERENFTIKEVNEADSHDLVFNFGEGCCIEITTNLYYKNFKVTHVETDFDDKKGFVVKKRLEYKEKTDLFSAKPIYIIASLGEVLPEFLVEFTRVDGIKGCFYISYSGKTGEFIALDYKLNHTLKSTLYYLFK